jgi:hypothetical protein
MYVIRKEIVAKSLDRLREQHTHTLFAGYIYLQKRAAELERLTDLQPEFLTFFKQFFSVEGHPLGAPYIKIFTEKPASSKNLWLNENVAGSYAPSSLRPEQPFRKVVDIKGKSYSLPQDHAVRAFEHLLYSIPVQVADLTVVLYRDFGFLEDSFSIYDLIEVFAYEFGYSDKEGAEPNSDFRKLYSLESTENWEENWLEKHE